MFGAGRDAQQSIRAGRAIEIRLPELERPEAPAPPPFTAGAAPGAGGAHASTFGWDTVFAVRVPDVNAALARHGVCPKGFAIVLEEDYAAEGAFGAWSIRPGGGGELLRFSIPVERGRLRFRGVEYPMDGARAIVELRLRYVSHGASNDAGAERCLLVADGRPPAPGVEAVSVLHLDLPGQTDGWVPPLMKGAIAAWMNSHLDELRHVFCAVELNRTLSESHAWLTPTRTGYAYADAPDEEDCLLGVLCMTQGREPDDAQNQLGAAAVPSLSRAGFCIEKQLFLREMVLPSLTKAFPGSRARDFAMENGAVVNRRELELPPVEEGGSTYQPVLKELSVTLQGDEIRIDTTSCTPVSWGVRTWVSNTSWLGIELGEGKDGRRRLSWRQTRPPSQNHRNEVDPGVEVAKILLGIITAIVGAVAIATTGGAAILGFALLLALVGGVEYMTRVKPEEVAKAIPSIDQLVIGCTGGIRWAGASEFRLTEVTLSGAFQLGGDPCFVS